MNPTTESSSPRIPTVAGALPDEQWRGNTLEQLRMRRAMALVRREVERERLNSAVTQLRTRVSNNGVRGMLFSDNTISRLRVTDYALMGWRLALAIFRLRRRRRR